MPSALAIADDASLHMQCMEVWGGNQPVDNAVVMAGLDAWVYSRPCDDSDGGGDVYYVSSCATGRITRLLLADVSGHGAVVGQTAQSLRRLMQRYVNYIDQRSFVRSMNRQFAELSHDGSFATAIVSTFFAPINELTLCIAGHPPPLVYRAGKRQWMFLNQDAGQGATNIPLGIEDVRDWAQFEARLDVGDLVLCYTDSLIESHGSDGELLGPAGLRRVLETLDASDPSRLIAALLEAVASISPGNLSHDDVSILLFRPNGTETQPSLRERLCAPFRVMRGVVRAVVSGAGPIPWPEPSVPAIGGAVFRPFNRLRTRHNS